MTRYLAALCACLFSAQAQIGTPRAGCLRGQDNSLRPVYGTGGTFLAGAPVLFGAISAACSGAIAVVKTEDAIEVRDGSLHTLASWNAPAGTAIVAFSPAGRTAFVYFSSTGQLLRLDGERPPRTVLDSQSLNGEILAIASPDPFHLSAVVSSDTGLRLVRIALWNGTVDRQMPLDGVTAPVALQSDGTLVYADKTGLAVRQPDGFERHVDLPATPVAISQMDRSWLAVQLEGTSTPVAVRIEDARDRALRIPVPEAAQ